MGNIQKLRTGFRYIVEPLNNRHIGGRKYVLCREAILISEVDYLNPRDVACLTGDLISSDKFRTTEYYRVKSM